MATARSIGDPILVCGLHAVPTGLLMDWFLETPPTGWLERNGASLLITDYPELYAVIGKMYGSADANHFNLPDDRGLFGRGWDNGAGIDPDAASRTKPAATGATIVDGDHVGTEQAHALKGHNHTQNSHTHKVNPPSTTSGSQSADHTHTISKSESGHRHVYLFVPDSNIAYSGTNNQRGPTASGYTYTGITLSSGTVSADHTHNLDIAEFDSADTTPTNQATGGNETRPVNRVYMPIIKY